MWNSMVMLSALSLSDFVFGHLRWATRDGEPALPHPGSSGHELPLVTYKIAAACPSTVCETLARGALIPFQPECSQQTLRRFYYR